MTSISELGVQILSLCCFFFFGVKPFKLSNISLSTLTPHEVVLVLKVLLIYLFINYFCQLHHGFTQFAGVFFGIVLCLFSFLRFPLHIKGPIKLHHLLEENGHLCIIDGEHKSNNNGSIIFLFQSFLSLGLGPLILISSKWLRCGFSFRKAIDV